MNLEETRRKLLNKFKEETDTQLLSLQHRLVDLELDASNTDYLREVFRAAHTIKGSARMMNFGEISSIAHEMENIFAEMRDGRLRLQPETNDLLFEAVDTINTLVEAALRGDKTDLNVPGLNKRLAQILDTPGDSTATATSSGLASKETKPDEDANGTGAGQEAASLLPPIVLSKVGALSDNVIRVDVGKLDELMNIAGELVLGKMEAEATLNNLRALQDLLRQRQRLNGPVRNLIANSGRDPSEVTTWQEMREALIRLTQVDQQIEMLVKNTLRDHEENTSQLVNRVDELDNNVKSVRMLPIETIYQEFPLAVRSMAKEARRDLPDFRQQGGEIELDKKVLEGIRDPLVQIIKNSLVHGIELPQERLEANKPKAGRLIVSATQDGGFVTISVSDDGKGINPAQLRQKAIEKKIYSEARALAMSDEDIVNVIFESGFSTAPIIDDLAGRGVGMEIVKTNLERLGGQVSVNSQLGQGTTVTLRVPITMATSRALLVRVSGIIYAILAPAIESMFYLEMERVWSREGRDVTSYGNSLIPLVRLEDLIGRPGRADHPIFRHQELAHEAYNPAQLSGITAQNLTFENGHNPPAKRTGPSQGGYHNGNGQANREAVTGDGFVGLTLADPRATARIRELQEQNRDRQGRQTTLERLPAVVIGSGDRRICLLVDELVDETEIVVKSLSPLLTRAPHVNSATIMGDGQVVMILDVPSLIVTARQSAAPGLRKGREKTAAPKRILVVDDSITTRELERSILEAQGYIVELADDGTVALEMLSRDSRYDLVISDVEMPNMNGFELTTAIKASPALRGLPVIIVSSLNNDDHKRRGIEAGAEAYITKGDFEQANLLNTIEYLTS